MVTAYEHPGIRRWCRQTVTVGEASTWVASLALRWAVESGADWAVVGDRVVLGRDGLHGINLGAGCAEVVYWVLPAGATSPLVPSERSRIGRSPRSGSTAFSCPTRSVTRPPVTSRRRPGTPARAPGEPRRPRAGTVRASAERAAVPAWVPATQTAPRRPARPGGAST